MSVCQIQLSRVYVCVSSVRCTSKEWETSEYGNSLYVQKKKNESGTNAACDFLLRECGYDVMRLPASGFFSPFASWGLSIPVFTHWSKTLHHWTQRSLFWPSTYSYNTCMCFFPPLRSPMFKFFPFFCPYLCQTST